MCFGAWLDLLRRNRFRVGLRQLPAAFLTTCLSPFNSALGALQNRLYGARIAATRINPPPVFVLGHWRSGTTLLHELLSLHPEHTAPNTYECVLSNHFVLSEKWASPLLARLLPEERAMDAMLLRIDSPQEDEFALCNLGVPSPYLWISFPNGPYRRSWESLSDLPTEEVRRWKDTLETFLKGVTLVRPGRLIVKTPLHGFRVPVIEELFPGARYVHVVRHPAEVLSSTLRTWRTLHHHNGYQAANHAGLQRHVVETGVRMFHAIERARTNIPPERWCDVRYEELVKRPHDALRRIHSELALADYTPAAPAVRAYLSARRDHLTRTHVAEEDRVAVRRDWAFFFEPYGYDLRR